MQSGDAVWLKLRKAGKPYKLPAIVRKVLESNVRIEVLLNDGAKRIRTVKKEKLERRV